MPVSTRHHHFFPSLPRDYFRRRRVARRISNTIITLGLGVLTAYVITRQPAGGFSAPRGSLRNPPPAPAALPGGSLPAPAVAAGYKLADGPLALSEVPDIVLHDAKRNKDLHLRVFYPTAAGPFPVIIFSHGAGGSQNCCDALTRHWAAYGYVTLQPTHDDAISQRRDSGESGVNLLSGVRDALKEPKFWESRPADIRFLLDSLPALQTQLPALAGKLDIQHVGVGGHSMGAFTADAIAGALVDLPGHPATNFADPRVRAVLLLSPQGPGEFGLTDHSWDHVALPLLSMTGSLDKAANGQGPDWKKIPFERSQPGDKYHVFISGANHMSFISARTLLPGRAAQGEMILAYTNSAALAFWDAYLKADDQAKAYLRSDALPLFSNHAVTLDCR